jgi:hypothetical protein
MSVETTFTEILGKGRELATCTDENLRLDRTLKVKRNSQIMLGFVLELKVGFLAFAVQNNA